MSLIQGKNYYRHVVNSEASEFATCRYSRVITVIKRDYQLLTSKLICVSVLRVPLKVDFQHYFPLSVLGVVIFRVFFYFYFEKELLNKPWQRQKRLLNRFVTLTLKTK